MIHILYIYQHAAVAQLVEQWTENPCVVGPIPTGGRLKTFEIIESLFFCPICVIFTDGTVVIKIGQLLI